MLAHAGAGGRARHTPVPSRARNSRGSKTGTHDLRKAEASRVTMATSPSLSASLRTSASSKSGSPLTMLEARSEPRKSTGVMGTHSMRPRKSSRASGSLPSDRLRM